ncbi:MAG: FG-GAP-like repeat-containing protein [Thermoanaerobaculia bacterium]|nr:FG-GAP-like repeat-containing protein [Thermoanaerobaculia bacterium]
MKTLAALAIVAVSLQSLAAPPPTLAPEKASRVLSARNLGLAELEEGKHADARKTFEKLAALVPEEPLPLANAAIAALRGHDLATAEAFLVRARKLSPESGGLLAVQAAVEEARNRPEEARALLGRAAAADPTDLESRWRLARSVESLPQLTPAQKETRKKALAEIVSRSSSNLPARLKLILAELESGTSPAVSRLLEETGALLTTADPKPRQYFEEAKSALAKGDAKTAGLKVRVLENLLRSSAAYQQSLQELFTNVTGIPLERFSPALESALSPRPGAAIPVTFREGGKAEDPAVTLRRVDLSNSGKPDLFAIPAPHSRAVFLDFDLDGDLDVYLHAAPAPDKLLRNNLDGSFSDVTTTTGDPAFRSTDCKGADFDRDGDLDLVCVTSQGALALRSNKRQGRFLDVKLVPSGVTCVDAADLNADGFPDLLAGGGDGARVLIGKGRDSFEPEAPSALSKLPSGFSTEAVLLADLDNDGFPDAILSGAGGLAAFRRDGSGFTNWPVLKNASAADRLLAADADGDGDLDLVVSRKGQVSVLTNDGGNANGWVTVVLEGLQSGSGKVNKAGVGSLVEVKAGDLYVARTVGIQPLLIGIGARTKADVVRTLFTNGVPQNQLDVRGRTTVKEVQQLKGSCPFVYAFNGKTEEWSFVSDALGRAPLGLLYDGVHLAGADTREWLYIDRSQLQPDPAGRLVIDYTEELWEVTYLDEATLMAVDHPEGTMVVPNERMTIEPLERKLFTVAHGRPPRSATSVVDRVATDVLDALRFPDKVHVSPGPETHYQGVRREHSLVLDLGPVTATDRVVLFLSGWIFYTDTSINVALSQRGDIPHFPPLLEIPDGKGGWKAAMPSFGFPAGKSKTMPVDLTGLLDPADPRVRIRTTMAVFWDRIFVTVNDPPVAVVTHSLKPARAELSLRGFSRMRRETADGPEVFVHDDVEPFPKWQDVPGMLTRLGGVTELLERTDDRYVVFQGGDSIRIEYDASGLPPLRPGWRRDWILVSDGWDKDFDKNTVTGQTVEPWPFHAMSAYPYPETERHPDAAFLREWMTRPAGPEAFWNSVKNGKRP